MTADKVDEAIAVKQAEREYKEASDIFPALNKYQEAHSAENLQKLCVEAAEFCRAIYASTKSEDERKIYFAVLGKVLEQS